MCYFCDDFISLANWYTFVRSHLYDLVQSAFTAVAVKFKSLASLLLFNV